MKRRFLIATTVILLAAKSLYPGFGKVVKVDYRSDIVTIKTYGCTYKMKGCEDWHKGDWVALMMYDNGTPNRVKDDKIVKAYYINENF